jgi:hypothetical protein
MGNVSSIADLKALTTFADPCFNVFGCHSPGDGGGGQFYWDAQSTATDDGGTVISPASNPPVGRWKRLLHGPLSVKWFGAYSDGSHGAETTTAINAAISVVNATAPPTRTYQAIYFPAGRYSVVGGLDPIKADGVFLLGDGRDCSVLVGDETGNPLVTFGSDEAPNPIEWGGMKDLGLDYNYTKNVDGKEVLIEPKAEAIRIRNAAWLQFLNLSVYSVLSVARIGSATKAASAVWFAHVGGWLYYSGTGKTPASAGFTLVNGGGFWGEDISLIVGGGAQNSPGFPGQQLAGQPPLPADWPMTGDDPRQVPKNKIGDEPAATGVNFMQVLPVANQKPSNVWDTVYLSDCLGQLFTAGIFLYAPSGTNIEFVQVSNCTFDNCGQFGLFVSMGAQSISDIVISNSIFTGWDSNGIYLSEYHSGYGYIQDVVVTGCVIHSTGHEGIYLGGQVRELVITGCNVVDSNRFNGQSASITVQSNATEFSIANCITGKDNLGDKATAQAGIYVWPNCSNFSLTGNRVAGRASISSVGGYGIFLGEKCENFNIVGNNVFATSESGVPGAWATGIDLGHNCKNFVVSGNAVSARGPCAYGVAVHYDSDHYAITGNQFTGTTAASYVENNSTASKNRLYAANADNDYGGNKTGGIWIVPPSNVAWQNTTPFHVQAFIFGGSVSTIAKNGVTIAGMTSGVVTADPGETFTLTYSAVPNVTFFVVS